MLASIASKASKGRRGRLVLVVVAGRPLVVVIVWQVTRLPAPRTAATWSRAVTGTRSCKVRCEMRSSTLHNNSKSCEAGAEHAAQLAAADRERKAPLKLEEVQEYSMLLNQTASSRESALRAEQAKRLSLEGSVQTLKEQMNLMQGQLVTAQQQQGTLHGGSKRGRHH